MDYTKIYKEQRRGYSPVNSLRRRLVRVSSPTSRNGRTFAYNRDLETEERSSSVSRQCGNIVPSQRKFHSSGVDKLPAMRHFPPAQDIAQIPKQGVRLAGEDDAPRKEILLLVGMITAVSFVCSVDRAAMSVTIMPMSQQFGWDSSVKGAVSSSFFVGYMITNIFGGYLATRFSPRYVLAGGVLLWSLFTLDTPSAAQASTDSLTSLLIVRGIMGIGEGVAYPSIQNIVRKTVPDNVRTRSLSFIYSGHQLGTIASYLSSPTIMATYGWPTVFWSFGSLGFIWLSAWLPLSYAGFKGEKETSSSSSLSPDTAATSEALMTDPIPWKKIVSSSSFWAIVAAQVTVGIGSGLSFSWLPTYFSEQFGVESDQASYLCLIPFAVTVIATNCSGWIADGLVNNGKLNRTDTRKLMQGIASFGPALCLLSLAIESHSYVPNSNKEEMNGALNGAVALVTAWLALGGFSAAGYGSNHQDLSKKYSGILFGLCNGLASIAGSISIYATGLILNKSDNNWGLIFELAAVCYILGAAGYIKWASCEEEF
jgi:ACS family sodium-dependent inorganic phosphate cotransporter